MNASGLDWECVKQQLPAGWAELAERMGLIRPQPPQLGAKITHIEPVLRQVLLRAGLELSLQTATATTAAAKAMAEQQEADAPSLVRLSAPSLHEWERKLGPYLATLLAQMTGSGDAFSTARWSGYELMVADGTVVTRPGAKGTTARVLYAMRLVDMTVVTALVTDEHGSESLQHFEVRPNQLWICDRGYSHTADIAWVVQAQADVLVRLNRGALPLFDAEGRPVDALEHAVSLREPGAMAEWSVWVHPVGGAPIRGRLCALRLSEEEAEKARRRLRREQGPGVSREMLLAASWVLLLTTVPRERLSTQQILDLYPLRWQLELEIKREKSIGGLDKLPNFRSDTIATWLYAKLLLHQIARRIIDSERAFPPSAATAALSAAGVGAALFLPQPGPQVPRHEDRRRDVARSRGRLRRASRRPDAHRPA